MKKKDVIFAILAVVILLVAGYIAYTQLMPKKSAAAQSKVVMVEVIGPIPSSLNEQGLAILTDPKQVVNFNSPVDFTGLGNAAPFGR